MKQPSPCRAAAYGSRRSDGSPLAGLPAGRARSEPASELARARRQRRRCLSRAPQRALEHADQGGDLRAAVLLASSSRARRPPRARSPRSPCSARNSRRRPRAAGLGAPRRDVPAVTVLLERVQQLLDAAGRGSEETAITGVERAPSERSAALRSRARGDRHLPEVRLRDDQHVRDLHDPRLQELQGVPAAGLHDDDDGVGDLGDVGLGLADADGLDHDHVERRRQCVAAAACARARPPRRSPAAVERISTPLSAGSKSIRARSPSSEPPERRELGSTASMATVRARARASPPSSAESSVDLPAPGGPGDADDVPRRLAAERCRGDLARAAPPPLAVVRGAALEQVQRRRRRAQISLAQARAERRPSLAHAAWRAAGGDAPVALARRRAAPRCRA